MVISLINKKKGWIRILEAVIAVLLLSGVLIYITVKNQVGVQNEQLSKTVSGLQDIILEEISSTDSLRNATLNSDYSSIVSFVSLVLSNPNLNPGYNLNFSIGICEVNALVCSPTSPYSESSIPSDVDFYFKERIISSTLTTYSPKILRLYIWVS